VIEPIERTGIVRNERSQLTIQDLAQSAEDRGRINAIPSDRSLAFRYVIPARLLLKKLADLRRLFPLSIGADNRTGRIDDRDFREKVI
jgi:hypothetical protein